jgi:Asp-tRNA(Asn)/Glu-tRNA(Gln) amidotransferase A subunit family amidase
LLGYLERLRAHFDEREPGLRSFVAEPARFDRLKRQAEALLARYPDPAHRPPLFGVPVGLKDIIRVEGFPTRAGSQLPAEEFAGPEAPAATALRAAGALVLGKTVSTEFAYFGPGPTRNPHHPEHTPGGSSSGSAAAVAAGLVPLALGTQTIGSIIRPAAFCGVVGYKPSYERISREGVIPLAPSYDHVGLFAADVPGAAYAAALLCADWRPARPAGWPVLGVPEGPYLDQASPEALDQFRQTLRALEAAGCTVRRVPVMADFAQIRARHGALMAAEAAHVHTAWFQQYHELYHPRSVDLIVRGQAVPDVEVQQARSARETLRTGLLRQMAEAGLDLWAAPAATGPAPRGLDSTGDPVMNLPWTQAGLPALTIPAGQAANGLPLGLQLVAGWMADEGLLAWGEGIESVVRREAAGAS